MKKIEIEVKVFANLRDILELKSIQLNVEQGISIREILILLQSQVQTGSDFLNAIFNSEDHKKLRDDIKFVVNGEILEQDIILITSIKNSGDSIAIFPPIGGG